MKGRLVITPWQDQILTILQEEDRPVSIRCEDNRIGAGNSVSLVGNIYVGRVKSVALNIRAAFVEVQKGILCYLPLDEVRSVQLCGREYDGRLIEGDVIVVQVTQDRIKTKDATVTTELSFPGRYAVLTTAASAPERKISCSSKLTQSRKEALRLLAVDTVGEEPFSYIMRTNAGEAVISEPELVRQELLSLTDRCRRLLETAKTRTIYTCLQEEEPEYLRQIRSLRIGSFTEILTDEEAIFRKVADFLEAGDEYVEYRSMLRLYEDREYSLANLIRLPKYLSDALQKKVWLKSGGYLVIEPTEALTVIDVNSGKFTGKAADRNTVFEKINAEAAREIAYQMRLRNLSGIVLIDFINMDRKESRLRIMELLKTECRKDLVKTNVVDMTALGLVEVTRKRIYPSLREQLGNGKREEDKV